MSWLIFLIASVAVFLLTIVLTVGVYKKNSKFGSLITPTNTMFVGTFVAAYIAYMPIHIEKFAEEKSLFLKIIKVACIDFYRVFQTFSLDGDYFETYDQIMASVSEPLSYVYLTYISILFLVAPMITVGLIVLIFKNILATFSYFANFFKDMYIFSELNERSLMLAQDIKKNHPKAKIVYASTSFGDDSLTFELLNGAKQQRAICFKGSVDTINLSAHSKKSAVTIFLIGENETENSNKALAIIDRYGERENTNLYVFCTNAVGSLILSSPKEKKIKVRRIDEAQSLIYRQLYESGTRFFEEAIELPSGVKQVGALIVGMGRYGTEMIKALSWFCQMDGYTVKIDGFDKDKYAEEKFAAKCPELMCERLNGNDILGEAKYDITIHPDTEVSTRAFHNEISKLRGVSYVLVCLGDDEINVQTAVELRILFEASGMKPTIQAVVNNDNLIETLDGVTNFKGQKYDVELIGGNSTSYTESVIISSELEAEAMKIHRKYGDDGENFWKFEYNYRSSIASALHKTTRIKLGVQGVGKREEDLNDEEKLFIKSLEHRRWNAYMRSQGYCFSGSQDPKTRNDLAKRHHDLVPYQDLSIEEQLKDLRVATEESDAK